MKKKNVLVVSGPTGVGENTIVDRMVKKHPSFKKLVTATTRAPRLGEKNEIDYYFFSKKEFFEQIEKGNIPEYQNSRDSDVYYGTFLPDLKEKVSKGFTVIVTPNITGTKYFKKEHNATTIFILPDSMENLRKRHLKRDPSVSEEDLKKRLEYAEYEMKHEGHLYDYSVVNAQDKLDKAIEQIEKIILSEGYELTS